jgi:hypothetical protein
MYLRFTMVTSKALSTVCSFDSVSHLSKSADLDISGERSNRSKSTKSSGIISDLASAMRSLPFQNFVH